jgi:acetyltransferase
LVIRPILSADAGALRAFHSDLSDQVGHRYFGGRTELSAADLRLYTCVDGTDRLSVVAFDGPRLVGLARADRLGDQVNAEVAVVVDDDHRGLGIGTALLERLIEESRAVGIGVFEADIWENDHRMHSVFHRLGFRVRSDRDVGVVRLVFLIGPSATYELACRKRRRHLGFVVTRDTGA